MQMAGTRRYLGGLHAQDRQDADVLDHPVRDKDGATTSVGGGSFSVGISEEGTLAFCAAALTANKAPCRGKRLE